MYISYNIIPCIITTNKISYMTDIDQDTPPTLEEVIAENYDPNQPLGDETNEI